MEEEPIKTGEKPNSEDKPDWRDERGLFLPGNPGGPGRPAGKSLKEWVKEKLGDLGEEERIKFLKGIPRDVIWRMAEGNPQKDIDLKSDSTIRVISIDE